MKNFVYYTDGAATMKKINGVYERCAGGWSIVKVDEENDTILDTLNGGSFETTNNEQELYAIYAALRDFSATGEKNSLIKIYSDSAYSINIFTKWIEGWIKNGWTRGKKHEPIENLLLIQQIWGCIHFIDVYYKTKIQFIKVAGHSGNKYNEIADKLAVEGKIAADKTKHVIDYVAAVINKEKSQDLIS